MAQQLKMASVIVRSVARASNATIGLLLGENMSEGKLIVDGSWNIGPKYKSVMKVNTNLVFQFEKPMPNRWHRFWQKFLLGWEWSEPQRHDGKEVV